MDLEDLKRKLAFDNLTVRCRCITKLVEAVIKKKPKGKMISSSMPLSAELTFLWDVCGSSCNDAAKLAVDGIIYLHQNEHIDTEYAIKNFLSLILSNRNVTFLVRGLMKLLSFQADNDVPGEKLYSLKLHKHPFISALESKPHIWHHIFENTAEILFNENQSISDQGFQIMKPVLTYIYLNPMHSLEMTMMRHMFIQKLATSAVSNSSQVFQFLCQILPWMPVKSDVELADILNIISFMKKVITSSDTDKSMLISESLLLVSLTVVRSCIISGSNVASSLDIAEDISSRLKEQETSTSVFVEACLVVISVTLPRSTGPWTQRLLNIGLTILDRRAPSRIIAAMTIVPVVQILLEPRLITFSGSEKSFNLVMQYLEKVKKYIVAVDDPHEERNEENTSCFESFNPIFSQSMLCVNFTHALETWSYKEKLVWLHYVQENVSNGNSVSDLFFHLIGGLFLCSTTSYDLQEACLQVFEALVDNTSELSPQLFALLLYKHSSETRPENLLLIMKYLASTASNKYSVGPVLNILQVMAKHHNLKAQSIQFVYCLWKKQNRCFPYLQKLLVENDRTISGETGVPEIRITQAAIIKSLCFEVPDKCAGEFLGTLSTIISEPSNETNTPATLLALDAVVQLCKSEVIDLRSTWKALSSKLCRDKRPSIGVRVCGLLGLAPDLQVKSFQYDKFMNEAASYLWHIIVSESSSPMVIGSAYKALSGFSMDCYNLKQLPYAAKENLKLPASKRTTPFEMSKLPEDVLSYIPGYCFIDLLKNIEDTAVLEGYDFFLQSLIRQEVKDLPQSAYSQRKQISKKRNPADIISNIPGILCLQFPKLPGTIQKNLAVGILLSYEPPVEHDKDGKVVKKTIALHSRMYEQLLKLLLDNVNLDCNDWQRCLVLPPAWKTFMEKAFFACEESRRITLELQHKSGNYKESDFSADCDLAWLWTRDWLLNLIKSCAKNSSNSTANSIFAVAGLVSAVEKFQAGLDNNAKRVPSEYEQHNSFRMLCIDSILALLSSKYKSSKILVWLQPQHQSSSVSSLLKGCAGASLFILSPMMQNSDSDSVQRYCDVLFKSMFSSTAPALCLYSGIGFGLLVQEFFKETHISSHEKNDFLSKVMLNLKECLASEDLKPGYLIAVTLCVSSLAKDGSSECSAFVETVCQTLREALWSVDLSSMQYEALSICASCVLVTAACATIVPHLEVVDLMFWFEDRRQEMPQCSSTSISLGILVDALVRFGNAKGMELMEKLKKEWFGALQAEKRPTLQRIAALNGMCALFSAGRGLIQMSDQSSQGTETTDLRDLVHLMVQIISSGRDSGLQGICCWELGRLHHVFLECEDTTSTESSSYSYLGERSILKPLSKFLQICVTDDSSINSLHLVQALKAMSQNFQRPLPPLNWPNFLAPFLQMTNQPAVVEMALKLAMHQMASSPSALNLFMSYALPPVLHKLPKNCHVMLLKNICTVAQSLPQEKLHIFFKEFLITRVCCDSEVEKNSSTVMKILLEIQKHCGSSTTVISVINNIFKEVLVIISKDIQLLRTHLNEIGEFIAQMDEKLQCTIYRFLENFQSVPVQMFVLCHLVKIGKKSLSSLRSVIEKAKNESDKDRNTVISAFLDCMSYICAVPGSENIKPQNCVDFLMETIGWMTVLLDSSVQCRLENTEEVICFLVDVCLAVIIGSSGLTVTYVMWPDSELGHRKLLQALPSVFPVLAGKNIWNDIIEELIKWLLQLKDSSLIPDDDKCYIQAALCSFKSHEIFQKPAVWTEVISRSLIVS